MNHTRRTFLRNSVAVSSGVALSPLLKGRTDTYSQSISESTIQDSKIQNLIQRAVDAAMAAGAQYADARLVHMYQLICRGSSRSPELLEDMTFGVRALYQGYWGYAASTVWSNDEASRLGNTAFIHAKVNMLNTPRESELAPMADIESGHWTMPIKYDPFRMSIDEIADFASGLNIFIQALPHTGNLSIRLNFRRTDKAFGSSLNQYTTQTLFSTNGAIRFGVGIRGKGTYGISLDSLTPAGLGFEHFKDQNLREQILTQHEEALRIIELPYEPVDVGKYQILVPEIGTASLVSNSIGLATQVDRAMTYEANAGGTSYIVDPTNMLGSLKIGNSLLNISADRSAVGSVGTVRWDDEGVKPIKFDLVKDGLLVNMQVNREGAGWIKPYYARSQQTYQSYGCGYSSSGLEAPMIYNSDLILTPPQTSTETLDSLRHSLDNGVEIKQPFISMDFQFATGWATGHYFKIKNGKRIANLIGTGMVFRTPELWKNLSALGGATSVRRFGAFESKGEPAQFGEHSVFAPPVVFRDMTIIDVRKKG